jgi:egghead protein (zeste-white 4 protein)
VSNQTRSTAALAWGEVEDLSGREVVPSWESAAATDSGLRRPDLLPFLVAFLVVATVGDLLCRPLGGPLNWWFSVVCVLPLQASLLHLAGAIKTRRRLAEPFHQTARVKDPLIVVLPTIGRYDTLAACRRVVLSLIEVLPAHFDDFRVDVIIEERAEASSELQDLAGIDPAIRVVTVPLSYQTAKGSRFKARANQYALELRTAEGESTAATWVLHMDDDTAIRADTARAIGHFLSMHPEKHVAQGILCYPRQYSANYLTWLADAIRPSDDMGRFALLTGGGTPLAGLHGELLLIRASIEREIGWDFGPNEVTEDARFALMFAHRYPGRSAWLAGCSYGSSPQTVRDFCGQRARWTEGLLRIILSGSIPLRNRFLLASGLGNGIVGLVQHPAVLLPAAFLANLNTSPVIRPLIFIWAANLGRIIWQYWQGLEINSQASGRVTPRIVDRLAVLGLMPLFALGEGTGILLGTARLLTRRSVRFTVIAKNHEARRLSDQLQRAEA